MKTANDIIKEKNRPMITIASDQTVRQAINKMIENKIGAILVEHDAEIVGIWTERDLLRNINQEDFNPDSDPIEKYMTSPVQTASNDTPYLKLKDMFLGLFVRHLLIVDDEKHIGLLSIGDVMRASLLEQDLKLKELNAIASWEYYENWGWERKKR